MPPITIIDYEPDDDGGWLILWRDAANLDGEPLEGSFHATPESVGELLDVRRQLKAPVNDLDLAHLNLRVDRQTVRASSLPQRAALNIPAGVTPFTVRDWLDGYQAHIVDCIDRYNLGVKGGAPHEVLEAARSGGPVPENFRRKPAVSKVQEFAQRKRGAGRPTP